VIVRPRDPLLSAVKGLPTALLFDARGAAIPAALPGMRKAAIPVFPVYHAFPARSAN
jgi:hypothetical protein